MTRNCKLWALGLFLLFCALSPGRITAWDTAVRAAVSHQLWTHGTVFVASTVHETEGMVYIAKRQAFTSFYGIGQSLVLIPFDIVAHALVTVTHAGGKVAEVIATLPILFLYAPLVGLLWWWAIALLIQEMGIEPSRSRFLAALFLATTIAIVYITQSVQEEAIVGAIVTWALVFALRWSKEGAPRLAIGCGFLLAAALTFRPTAVFAWLPVLGVGAELAVKRSWRELGRGAAFAAAGALPAIAIQLAFAAWRFGSPFALGYDLAAAKDHLTLWRSPSAAVFFGLLAGPGKGLLILSPGLWLVFPGLRAASRRRPLLTAASLAAILGSLFLHAMRGVDPDGSICWATRYQTHLLGFLAPAFAFGFEALGARKGLRAAIIGAAVFVVGMGFMASDNLEYLQAEADSLPRVTLMNGVAHGQLGRRIATVTAALTGGAVSPEAGPGWRDRIDVMVHSFTPNLWGPMYGKKIDKGAAGLFLFVLLWLANLAAGAFLCVRAYYAIKAEA